MGFASKVGTGLIASAIVCALLAGPGGDAATASTRLIAVGGLDLDAYCQQLGYSYSDTAASRTGPGAAYNNWYCFTSYGGRTPIDLLAACKATYPSRPLIAQPTDANDANTWVCYRIVTKPAPALPSADHCAAVRVIGVRGSGEDPHSERAMGELPFALVETLAARLPHLRVTGEGLNYPAVGIIPGSSNFNPVAYGESVSKGDRALPALMRRRQRDCPTERWVLAAYSQGAEVLGDVLAKHPPGSGQVVAVVLWADPKYSPHSRADRGGANGWGILNGPLRHNPNRPPRSWASRTESWCNPVDIVCQGLGLNHTVQAHLTYQNWALRPAESFATAKLTAALNRH